MQGITEVEGLVEGYEGRERLGGGWRVATADPKPEQGVAGKIAKNVESSFGEGMLGRTARGKY